MELQSQLSKAFVKKTRKGKVIKLVREKYLREDVGCGYLFGSCVSKVSVSHGIGVVIIYLNMQVSILFLIKVTNCNSIC
jgi:hypothetical protein